MCILKETTYTKFLGLKCYFLMGVPQLETVHPTAQLCNTKFNIYNTHYKQDNKVN